MAGNVSVRFSVEDQEVVRKALEDLGKAGEAALKKMDAASREPSKGLAIFNDLVGSLKERVVGLAAPIGPFGNALIALGPAGLLAAAGIGALMTGLHQMSDLANELGTKAQRITGFSNLVGISTDQLQAFGDATLKAGKSQDDTNSAVERAVQAWDQLRKGQGDAFDQIRKIDPALLDQLAAAKDASQALEILARAYARAGDQASKLSLARAFGGKQGAGTLSALFGGINEAGGIDNLTKEARETGAVLDKELLQRLATLKTQIADIQDKSKDIFASMFSESTLRNAKEWADLQLKIVLLLKEMQTYVEGIGNSSFWSKVVDWSDRLGLSSRPDGLEELPGNRRSPSESEGGPTRITVHPGEQAPPPKTDNDVPLAVQLRKMRDWVGLLGSAATSSELYGLKQLELRKAVEDGIIPQDKANRALAAYKRSLDAANEATRERLGVATLDDITQQRLADLRDARTKGIIKNDEELARAEALVRREAKDTADALAVRNSAFKGLTQLSQDAGNLDKQLDQLGTGSLNNLNQGLLAFETGQKSAGAASRDLAKAFGSSILQMINQMVILQPIALGLRSILGGITGGLGLPIGPAGSVSVGSQLFPKYAGGTDFAPGGLSMVGERGPEIVDLPRGARVYPHDVTRRILKGNGSRVGDVRIGATNIIVQGSMTPDAIPEIRKELAAHRKALTSIVNQAGSQQRFSQNGNR